MAEMSTAPGGTPGAAPAAGGGNEAAVADIARRLQDLTVRAENAARRVSTAQTLSRIAGYSAVVVIVVYGFLFYRQYAAIRHLVFGKTGDATESPLAQAVKDDLKSRKVIERAQASLLKVMEKAAPEIRSAVAEEVNRSHGAVVEKYTETFGDLDDEIERKFENAWRPRVLATVSSTTRLLREALPASANPDDAKDFVRYLQDGLISGVVEIFEARLEPAIGAIKAMHSHLEKFEGVVDTSKLTDAQVDQLLWERLQDLVEYKIYPKGLLLPVDASRPKPPAKAPDATPADGAGAEKPAEPPAPAEAQPPKPEATPDTPKPEANGDASPPPQGGS
ncbi:MAG: hypothetical protein HYZ53_04990 [Planctomycetes bacterium]|nr:hypothetical protein [Planctomycetota bacterium]